MVESPWKRYGRIYGMLWRNALAREMSFKSNFLLWIVVEFLWFALQLAFMTVIYQHTDRIQDWSRWEVILLVGTSHFIQQVFQAFFLTNCTQLSELVRTGKLDFVLLLPANSRFLLSLRQVDLGGFINAASAVAVMAYAARQLALRPGATELAAFGLLCVAGILIHYSLMFMLASISFWTVRAQGIVWGYYSMFNIARLPDTALQGSFRMAFTFVIPMLLVSNVPARLLADKLGSIFDMALLLLMALLCWLVSGWFWRFSVRRYTSASA